MVPERAPLFIGLRAARANLLPALVIQSAMVAIVAGYYWHPPTREALEILARWKAAGSYGFSCVAGVIAGSLLPELFQIVVLQRGKASAANLSNLKFTAIYWGLDAILVDAFYRLQTHVFGSNVDAVTVTLKLLVDQLLFTAFIATPLTLACYEWRNQGYSFRGLSRVGTWEFYKTRSFPVLVTNWAMWIPIIIMVYSLPPLLQVPLFALALCLWVMLFTYISKMRRAEEGEAVALAPK